MTDKLMYKFGVIYTDGGERHINGVRGSGAGIHGYLFDELEGTRYAKVSEQITPSGYAPKLTGAQIKDDNYNPEYTAWGHSVKSKDKPVLKEANGKLVDGWFGIFEGTSQRGELEAFINTFNNDSFECEKYTIYSDSNYLIKGIKEYLPGWKRRNWVKGDGTEVKNLDLWKKIDDINIKYEGRFELNKIKAHAGHYGNEAADRNATYGVTRGSYRDFDIHWKFNDLLDSDYWESPKSLPTMLMQKWLYTMSNEEVKLIDINGEVHYQYFVGDHNKHPDDLELLGKEMSDAGFSVIFSKERTQIAEDIKNYHCENMYSHNNKMYQSDYVMMINLKNIESPKIIWELNNARFDGVAVTNNLNDLVSVQLKDTLLSKVLRPPKLSFRAMNVRDNLVDVLKAYCRKTDNKLDERDGFKGMNVVVNDVTDFFYDTTTKKNGNTETKLSSNFSVTTKDITLEINNPCSDKKCKIILLQNVDLPNRSIMTRLAKSNPKVSIVSWMFDKIMCYYGLVIDCDEGIGIWSGYSSNRILNSEEQ